MVWGEAPWPGLVGRGKDCGHYFKAYEKPLIQVRWGGGGGHGGGGEHRHRTKFVFSKDYCGLVVLTTKPWRIPVSAF